MVVGLLHLLAASFVGPSARLGWQAVQRPALLAAPKMSSLAAPFSFDSTSQTAYDFHDGLGMVGMGYGRGYGMTPYGRGYGMGYGGYGGYGRGYGGCA